ncbi:MAG TPA: flippase [Burkholderiales bacterium]|nr:flippase [Burkholderiales bacterium]
MPRTNLDQGPSSRLLARNALLNLSTQFIVAVVAILLVPIIIRGLGTDGYGLLALAMVVFGTFSVLDLGLGRATTKYVAEYLSQSELQKLAGVVWASLVIQILLGSIAGFLLAILAPILAGRVLQVPYDRIGDATATLYVLAASGPIVLATSTLRGALEGAHRFDLVNYVKIFLNLSTYVIPLAFIQQDFVWAIVFWMLIARLVAMAAFLIGCLHVIPALRQKFLFSKASLLALFRYSGWVAVSNVIVPFLVQLDRFLIASLVTLGAVTFYSAPYELLYGLWIIPGSITAVLFPAFSGLQRGDQKRVAELVIRPIKYILITLGPLVLVLMAFSEAILFFWLGEPFSDKSKHVLQLLAFGVLINSLAWVPTSLVGGFGRPDVTTKIHLAQLPLYLGIAYPLISNWGVVGAAIAFCLRVTFEAVLLFNASMRLVPQIRVLVHDAGILSAVKCLIIFAFVVFGVGLVTTNLVWQLCITGVSASGFVFAAWTNVLDENDKKWIASFLPSHRPADS